MTRAENDYIKFDFSTKYSKEIEWLFEQQNVDGLYPVFFILYSYRHNLAAPLDKNAYQAGNDALQDKLYEASLRIFMGDKSQFSHLSGLQKLIESIKKSLFDEAYVYLLDGALRKTNLVSGTQLQPNARIATTIANILKEHGCETVFGAFSGIGIYALACEGMRFTGAEPYAPANLIAEVLCDAYGITDAYFSTANPLEPWTSDKYDAVIGNLPVDVDFANESRADRYLSGFNAKQNEFIQKLLKRKTARKSAAILIHFRFANERDYDKTRMAICQNGLLEMVIALPENIFREAYTPSYLLILDMAGGHNEAIFMDATASMDRQSSVSSSYWRNRFDLRECVKDTERVQVSYETIANASWSFNPAVYLQNAICREGQELVRLGDIASVSYGHMGQGERFIDYRSLSDDFRQVASGITPTVANQHGHTVEGPCILLGLTKATRKYSQNLVCGICRDYGEYSVEFFLPAIKPDSTKVIPDYLALALMSDPSFARYFKAIQEYYTDEIRITHLLERRIPIYTDMVKQKKAVLDALGRADMADITYNIVVAGAGDTLNWYQKTFLKYGCNLLESVDSVEGPEGLEQLLKDRTREDTPASQRIDAVVYVPDIPLSSGDNEEEEKEFSGLDAIIDLSRDYKRDGIPFYASSNDSLDIIRESGFFSPRRLRMLESGHFFMNDENGRPTDALTAAIREELDRTKSPVTRVRARNQAAFEAAEWLDQAYADKNIRAAETISKFLMAAEEGTDMSGNLSQLRNVAHRIIEILKECNAVPPLDNGAIPHLLLDGKYWNKKDGRNYIQRVSIMSKPLSSSLISLIDIGNEGTHSSESSANLGSAMLQILLEFMTWYYDNHNKFSGHLSGYWTVDSDYEDDWEETSGPAVLEYINGKPFWSCRDVHLFVGRDSNLKAGDIVTVRKRTEDTGKVRKQGVLFFAYPKDDNNPNGYTFEKFNP